MTWRKSSYSGGNGGGCVEVGAPAEAGRVLVRDTKDRQGQVLAFSPRTWRNFCRTGPGFRGGARSERPVSGNQVRGWRKSVPPPLLWAVWLATRTALYLHATVPGRDGDVGLYQRWYACCFSHGTFPVADPMWQYPPGAALVFWLPGRLPGSYVENFMVLAIGCDLAITVMLCVAGPARRVPGRSLVLGVRRAAARPGHRRPVRRGPGRAFRRRPVRDPPGQRPRRPDRSRGGGQGMAGHAAGRLGSRPAAPRCCRGSGRAGRGLRSSPAERRASSRIRTPAASRSNRSPRRRS